MTFAHDIKTARRQLRLTQVQMAARLGVDKQSVSNWECERSAPWPKLQAEYLQLLTANVRERIIDRCLGGLDDV